MLRRDGLLKDIFKGRMKCESPRGQIRSNMISDVMVKESYGQTRREAANTANGF